MKTLISSNTVNTVNLPHSLPTSIKGSAVASLNESVRGSTERLAEGSIERLTGKTIEASIGITLFIVFVALGIGKILTGIAIWRFLKIKDKKPSYHNKKQQDESKQKNESKSKE